MTLRISRMSLKVKVKVARPKNGIFKVSDGLTGANSIGNGLWWYDVMS